MLGARGLLRVEMIHCEMWQLWSVLSDLCGDAGNQNLKQGAGAPPLGLLSQGGLGVAPRTAHGQPTALRLPHQRGRDAGPSSVVGAFPGPLVWQLVGEPRLLHRRGRGRARPRPEAWP